MFLGQRSNAGGQLCAGDAFESVLACLRLLNHRGEVLGGEPELLSQLERHPRVTGAQFALPALGCLSPCHESLQLADIDSAGASVESGQPAQTAGRRGVSGSFLFRLVFGTGGKGQERGKTASREKKPSTHFASLQDAFPRCVQVE